MLSDNNSTFVIETYQYRETFRDEDLNLVEGKVMIDLRRFGFGKFFNTYPDEFEMPVEILERRALRRKETSLEHGALYVDKSVNPVRYYYLDGQKLRILQGEKEVTVDKIENVYGKPAIKAEGLELGYTHLALPEKVIEAFEKVLMEKELQKLALVFKGKSAVDGREYYGLNMEPSEGQWSWVQKHFVDFGTTDKILNGWLTWDPQVVAKILEIPIEGQ